VPWEGGVPVLETVYDILFLSVRFRVSPLRPWRALAEVAVPAVAPATSALPAHSFSSSRGDSGLMAPHLSLLSFDCRHLGDFNVAFGYAGL
jgi:hypothetical protein